MTDRHCPFRLLSWEVLDMGRKANERSSRLRREVFLTWHPLLDGYSSLPVDPLVAKAEELRSAGVEIVSDRLQVEGAGVIHILEWIGPQ